MPMRRPKQISLLTSRNNKKDSAVTRTTEGVLVKEAYLWLTVLKTMALSHPIVYRRIKRISYNRKNTTTCTHSR